MLKRFFSFLLAVSLIISILGVSTPVFAAINENYAVKYVGKLDGSIQYQGRNTYTVDFQVKTLNNAVLFSNQALFIAFDATVFEWVSYDASTNLEGAGLSLGTGFKEFGGYDVSWTRSGWGESILGAVSADGKTGYIQYAPYKMAGAKVSFADFTALQSVRLAFKPDKSFKDMSDDSIRLITSAERDALKSSDILLLNDGNTLYSYGNKSLEDTLAMPIKDMESATLDVSSDTWNPVAIGESMTATVTSNASWTAASSDEMWLTVSPASGDGDGSLTLIAAENKATAPRAGTVTVSSGSLTKEITVTQDAAKPVITITAQPAPTTNVTAGSITGSLTIGASVNPSEPLMYQWYSNTTASNAGGTAIDGTTASSFPIPADLAAGTYYYYCVVSADGAVSVASDIAAVTVAKAAVTYTVTFNANGGTPTPAPQTVAEGGYVIRPADPTRTGFTFDGWFANGSTTAFNFAATPITANLTLTAKWTAKPPSFSIIKTNNLTGYPATVVPGQQYSYTITLIMSATASDDYQGTFLSAIDVLDANLIYLGSDSPDGTDTATENVSIPLLNFGLMEPGAYSTVTINVKVKDDAVIGTVINNSINLVTIYDNITAYDPNPPTVIAPIYGDFTGNGRVDATDVLWVQRYIPSGRDLSAMLINFPTTIDTFYEPAADFTNNGRADATDVLWIQRYIASGRDPVAMINNFPTTIDFSHLMQNVSTPASAAGIYSSDTANTPGVYSSDTASATGVYSPDTANTPGVYSPDTASTPGVNLSDAMSVFSAAASIAASAGNTITLTPSNMTIPAGSTFTVTISQTTSTPIAGVEFNVNYDSNIIKLDSAVRASDKVTVTPAGNFVSITSSGTDPIGDGDLAVLTFTVLDASEAATISLTGIYASDQNDKEIAYSVEPITVNVVLENIVVTTQPSKTAYFAGETLDLAGMVVTAMYSNGSSKPVTSYTTTPANGAALNTVGTQTVTVSYTEGSVTKTASFTVEVNAVPILNISIDSRLTIEPVSRAANSPSFNLHANAAVSGTLIVVAYDTKGRMMKSAAQAFSLTAGQDATVSASLTSEAGMTYRFFIWDSVFAPLTVITSVSDLPKL